MTIDHVGRKRRPLWQWIVLGLLIFILSSALLLVGFFRFTQTGREIGNLTAGTVELMRLSATDGEGDVKTEMGQWLMRIRRGLMANNAALQAGVKDLAAAGFMSDEALTLPPARAKAQKGIDRYASVLRSIQSANRAIEGTAQGELAALPIPAGTRAGLHQVWGPTFGDLIAAMDQKLAAEEEFVTYAGTIYDLLDQVEAKAGYRVVGGQLQFNAEADADAYAKAHARLERLRTATQAAHERYMAKATGFQQNFQAEIEKLLGR